MMRKKIVSLCMALALCLGLLPATALAVDEDVPDTLLVGGTDVKGGGYWTTNSTTGELTQSSESESWNVHYDTSNNTLTLQDADITGAASVETSYLNVGIYASSSSGDVSLNIELQDNNEITSGSYGIWAYSPTNGGNASLSIEGENDGSLNVSGSGNSGIQVQSNSGNATLSIKNAKVTATSSHNAGVVIQSSDGSDVSLTVDGGNLTATGSGDSRGGIEFRFGTGESGSGTPRLNVSNSAIVKASGDTGGITSNSSPVTPSGTGIVFNNGTGTVYGDATLQEALTIGEDESLTIPNGTSLTVNSGVTLTNEGTVTNNGTLTNNGTIDNSGTLTGTISGNAPPSITTTSPLASGTVGTEYSVTLEANNSTSGWSVTSGSLPDGLTLDGNTGLISGTPTTAGTSTFTVKAANDYGSDSKELSIIIDEQTDVPVTGVSLNTSTLNLIEGGTDTLTATVEPNNATNRNVTWSSDNPSVATVNNGVVSAVSAGTATITATTADGGFTAACTVTVRPEIPPANPNYRITVEATQGGTVTADPTAAKAGATVTLTPVPDRGYQVGSVAVTDRFGNAVAVTEQADGTYTFTMPNGQVTVTVTFAETPLPFTDVTEGDWFYDAVRYAYETGLMDGVGDSLFAPNSETTRAQLVTILYRLAGQPAVSGDLPFTDVEAGTWYTDAVAWAAENGIVNGTTDATFAPGEDITREQLVTVLYRYAESKGYDVSASADLSGYPDAGQVQSYATESVAWAVAEGLIQGFEDNTLRPAGNATRAQIATILMRFCEGVAK